ncbi:hypothetical protein RvY_17682 [Ramazzottius varieornatus]|uniref:Uncharacterized protein n=1 Tax=Ramazzottius varieornatus TaxID=947166 RepID=A0A1D1W2Z1_RAMVA|nr:hypothetical protein RvY_17682 [Ramazzottius varieornatus]
MCKDLDAVMDKLETAKAISSSDTGWLPVTKLIDNKGKIEWRATLEAIPKYLPEKVEFPRFQNFNDGPVLFLRGDKSDYVTEKEMPGPTPTVPQKPLACIVKLLRNRDETITRKSDETITQRTSDVDRGPSVDFSS